MLTRLFLVGALSTISACGNEAVPAIDGGPRALAPSDGAPRTLDGGWSPRDDAEAPRADAGVTLDDAGPPVPGETSFRFLVYGDSRAGNGCAGNAIHTRLVEAMRADTSWSFVVNVGDMVTGYDASTCFVSDGDCTDPTARGNLRELIAPLRARPAPAGLPVSYLPVIGNHDDNNDWYPDPCGGRICDVFDMPALINHPTPTSDPCGADYPSHAYYSFRFGNSAFFVLRVNSDYFDLLECNSAPAPYAGCAEYCRDAPPSPARTDSCYNVHQYDWLRAELERAADDATIRHRFVLLHAPIYTSFDDHPPTASAPALRELFDRYRVDLVLNGHNHTYERTVPITAGARAAGGTVYVTTGGGGSPVYSPAGDWFTAAMAGVYHYVAIDVDGPTIRAVVIDVDGNVIDSF